MKESNYRIALNTGVDAKFGLALDEMDSVVTKSGGSSRHVITDTSLAVDACLRNPFLLKGEGTTVFLQIGDAADQYVSFIVHPCHGPAVCKFHPRSAMMPGPGKVSKWPCGCKVIAVSMPPDFVEEGR